MSMTSPPAFHEDPASDDRRVDGSLRQAEDGVADGVPGLQGRRRIVVENRDVGHGPFAKRPEREAENPGGDARICSKKRRAQLREAGGWIVCPQMPGPEGNPQFLEHVCRHRIRAEAHEDAAPDHRPDVGDPHGIVQVGLGIVYDRGPRFGEDVHFPAAHVHAMGGEASFAEYPKFFQPFDDPELVPTPAVILVALRLGHVNVKA